MTAENKKIVIYGVGAIVVGAIGFFVYSFFKTPIPVSSGNTLLNLGEGNEDDIKATAETTKPNTVFSEMLNQEIKPITTPNVFQYSKTLLGNSPTLSVLRK